MFYNYINYKTKRLLLRVNCLIACVVHTRYDKRILDIYFLSNALFYNLNQSVMSIGRRPALDAGGCRFESYHSDQNNVCIV